MNNIQIQANFVHNNIIAYVIEIPEYKFNPIQYIENIPQVVLTQKSS